MSEQLTSQVKKLKTKINTLNRNYSAGGHPFDLIGEIGRRALEICNAGAEYEFLDTLSYPGLDETRDYHLYRCTTYVEDARLTRPINDGLYERAPGSFRDTWEEAVDGLLDPARAPESQKIDRAVYTAVQAVGAAFDLKSRSRDRKTLGTFFEIVTGTFLGGVSGNPRGTSITLECEGVTTTLSIDLHLKPTDATHKVLAVPVKTSTRERAVQIYADHMLLERLASDQEYRTILVAVSELQRTGSSVQETCSPGKIHVYQRHLATMDGLYYLDPPLKYLNAAFASEDDDSHLPVRRFSDLVITDLAKLIT